MALYERRAQNDARVNENIAFCLLLDFYYLKHAKKIVLIKINNYNSKVKIAKYLTFINQFDKLYLQYYILDSFFKLTKDKTIFDMEYLQVES